MRIIFAFIFAAIFSVGNVYAQIDSEKVKVSTDKVKISGKLYYVHTVRAGESLYSIAKAYEIAQAAIIENNPELYKGIEVGNTIKIPVVQKLSNPNSNKELYHIVKKGETLYGISREYNLTVDELSKVNLLTDGKIQENQVLFIAKDSTKVGRNRAESLVNKKPIAFEPDANLPVGTISHEVQPKETLYSISRHYHVPVQSIIDANPELKEGGLQIGQTIVIPGKESEESAETAVAEVHPQKKIIDCPDYLYNPSTTFNVVLMLPLSINAGAASESAQRKADEIMQYYEGTLIAIDSLKNSGVSINLTVIDTKNDKEPDVIARELKSSVVRHAQLIIGPVYSDAVAQVAAFADAHKIPMVSPLAANTAALKNHAFLIQAANETSGLEKHAINYAKHGENIETVLVVPANEVDSKMHKAFKAALGSKVSEIHYTSGRNTANQRAMLKHKLKDNKINRFVVLSNNEVFVLDFLQNLSIASKEYNVEVLGTAKWLKFTSIDMQYIHESNVEMFVNNFVDYTSPEAKEFVRKFRSFYRGDPSNYAFRGFDVAYFFIDALRNYGPDFINCLPNISSANIHTPFTFEKEGNGGYRNRDAVLIRHVPGYLVEKRNGSQYN